MFFLFFGFWQHWNEPLNKGHVILLCSVVAWLPESSFFIMDQRYCKHSSYSSPHTSWHGPLGRSNYNLTLAPRNHLRVAHFHRSIGKNIGLRHTSNLSRHSIVGIWKQKGCQSWSSVFIEFITWLGSWTNESPSDVPTASGNFLAQFHNEHLPCNRRPLKL